MWDGEGREVNTLVSHVTNAFIVTRLLRLIRDLQYINKNSPTERAGKGSFLLSSHADGPSCVIQVNCNKHS